MRKVYNMKIIKSIKTTTDLKTQFLTRDGVEKLYPGIELIAKYGANDKGKKMFIPFEDMTKSALKEFDYYKIMSDDLIMFAKVNSLSSIEVWAKKIIR